MRLNGLAGPEHRFVRDDALGFLQHHSAEAGYDLVIVDPPTFSNSKKTDDVWDIQRDHGELLHRVIGLMASGGVMYFSTNSRRFKLDDATLTNVTVREISRQTVPEDFRNRRIHRCWRLIRSSSPMPRDEAEPRSRPRVASPRDRHDWSLPPRLGFLEQRFQQQRG